jgi:hypothetical protein
MPKKKTEAETAQEATTPKAKKAKAEPKAEMVYTHTGQEPSCKMPPQALGILNIIKEAKTIGRTDLVSAMDGVIQTKQPLTRILAYYQKLLLESGAVEVTE